MYIPELVFGHLLSSSNYDDHEKKLTGGRNGYGTKLANIYSTEFIIDTADKGSGQKYKQIWTDNAARRRSRRTHEVRSTRATFTLDLKHFGMASIDLDTVGCRHQGCPCVLQWREVQNKGIQTVVL
jgi:DNA topoisomerase-2